MRRFIVRALAAAALAHVVPAAAFVESGNTAAFGVLAGSSLLAGGTNNAFFGFGSGASVTTGDFNTFLGNAAGSTVTTNGSNTMVGSFAGATATGHSNVFIGFGAGYGELGNNKLVIDNCFLGGGNCAQPIVYGEFDTRLLRFDGVVHVTAHQLLAAPRSQLHFSVDGNDVGGWLTSVLDNNFFMSSGARWDGDLGGWIQRAPDGKSVMAGSGGAGYRIFTSSGAGVGAAFSPTVRMHIDYDGNVGFNTAAVAGKAIDTATGAHLSAGGAWVNASSRERKDNIRDLDPAAAVQALEALRPVTFNYRDAGGEAHVGFIAEDVPDLVATADRKGLVALDVVAVLTQVLKEKSHVIDRQERAMAAMAETLARLERELTELKEASTPAHR